MSTSSDGAVTDATEAPPTTDTASATEATPAPDPFYMAGTEGTGKYNVVVVTPAVSIGVRNFGGGFRVRVELTGPKPPVALGRALTPVKGWKQPGDGGQQRYSKVARDAAGAEALVTEALQALGLKLKPSLLAAATTAATELAFPPSPAPEPVVEEPANSADDEDDEDVDDDLDEDDPDESTEDEPDTVDSVLASLRALASGAAGLEVKLTVKFRPRSAS
jgi:hypothetical protein